MTLSFDDANVTLATDLNCRVMTAVRLVKAVIVKGDGDTSGDGKVDMNDALLIVNYLMGNAPDGFNAAAADVNGDGVVDIADAVALLDVIMNSGGAGAPKMEAPDPQP